MNAIHHEGWPALLTQEMAGRYLSLDMCVFEKVVGRFHVNPVEPASGCVRWRKADLDRVARRLEPIPHWHTRNGDSPPTISLDHETLRQLAGLLASKLEATNSNPTGDFLTVRDVIGLLKIGRSTVYKLISKGDLETKRVGHRTLITRASIARLLD